MTPRNERKPLRNFFVKRSMQFGIIGRIMAILAISAALTTAGIAGAYMLKSQKGSYYYMSDDVRQDIELINILGMVLPSIIAAQAVSLLIGLGIGLFSSRKAAVPVYKFEKWVSQLKHGKLNTHIAFREESGFKDLAIQCNAMADVYKDAFREIRDATALVEAHASESPGLLEKMQRIRQALARFDI